MRQLHGHDREGALKRQKVNAYNVFVLLFLGFGSVTYGYTASIIGTTLGLSFPNILDGPC